MPGQRSSRAEPLERGATIAPVVIALGWAAMLGLILRRPLFVTLDSVSNYAHVWFIQDRLWQHHSLPYAMPVIGHGAGLAYPYGFIPWTTAALLWPLLGSWAVTLTLVVGTTGLILATFWTFPELRRGWWAAAVLINPALVAAPISGQLPFIWAMTLLLLGVGCWRRDRRHAAVILVGLGQATHPAVVLPIGVLLVAWWYTRAPDRRLLLRCYAVSLALTAPAAGLVFASPVVGDTTLGAAIGNLVGTVASRGLTLLIPLVLIGLQRRPASARLAFAAVLALGAALIAPLHMRGAISSLTAKPDRELLAFIRSPEFRPGATYRLMNDRDHRVGMYELVRHHARLDSEFFPESMERHSWPDPTAYSGFLRDRGVDFVIIFDNYDSGRHTNEHTLLRDLARASAGCDRRRVGVRSLGRGRGFEVYRIRSVC